MKYPKTLVEVSWIDAVSTHGWETDAETDLESETMTTIGFIIAGNEESVIIASTIDATGVSNNCRLKIPVGMINTIREIRTTYVKKKIEPGTIIPDESPEPNLLFSEGLDL
jgi:hypothetical protein